MKGGMESEYAISNQTMRIIGHLDMDAFFAAIEERDRPRLQGKPIVVGSDPKGGAGRGVVSTANYAARKYGIRSALPISTAWKLSEAAKAKGLPEAVFIGGDMEHYGQVSSEIMAIVREYVAHVEQASVDEAYLELSFTGSYEKAETLCQKIKQEIKRVEHLTCSVGIGPNKLIAKIASDQKKPDGLTLVREEEAEQFLEPFSIRAIPGVGPKAEEHFQKLRVATVKDLKSFSRAELQEILGKHGVELYERIRGRDETPLVEVWEAKSVGEQETFEEDSRDSVFLEKRLRSLAREVHERFRADGFKSFGRIVLTVRFSDFTTKNRSETLPEPTDSLDTLQFEALRLFMPFLDARENPKHLAFRLLGVRVERLG